MYCKDINKKKKQHFCTHNSNIRYIILLCSIQKQNSLYIRFFYRCVDMYFQFESCLDIIGIQLCRFVSNKEPNRANLKYIISWKTDFPRRYLLFLYASCLFGHI